MNEEVKITGDGQDVRVTRAGHGRRRAIMLSVPILLLCIGLFFWLTGGHRVSTDNAYVKQDIVGVSTQLQGPIAEVFVRENQHVKKGDPLYRIDTSPFEVALEAATAQMSAAELQTRQLKVQAAGTGGTVAGARANLATAEAKLARSSQLLRQGFTTRADHDDALNGVAAARAALSDAIARANNANAAVAPGEQPSIQQAVASIDRARLDIRRSTVVAPESGIVSQASRLLVGQAAIPGVNMLSIVRDGPGWVTANFKEGDLARMKVGQKAIVEFDAYPGLKARAHICSIGAGTGSEFSILPAQNASGNWVKVTQRVPVRVCFDGDPGRAMIAGLSAHVDVDLDS